MLLTVYFWQKHLLYPARKLISHRIGIIVRCSDLKLNFFSRLKKINEEEKENVLKERLRQDKLIEERAQQAKIDLEKETQKLRLEQEAKERKAKEEQERKAKEEQERRLQEQKVRKVQEEEVKAGVLIEKAKREKKHREQIQERQTQELKREKERQAQAKVEERRKGQSVENTMSLNNDDDTLLPWQREAFRRAAARHTLYDKSSPTTSVPSQSTSKPTSTPPANVSGGSKSFKSTVNFLRTIYVT